ncbi:monovalent cation:proton antiporter-2 (CPA2) family protein [Aurantimonas sp. MSK8Z-1]|uniref:monovalent cation:proton antiporter-2 (CPA2) family protein n=1 Tax=Mangrovibrevibacter kandeliae TaxID=2968473 RepID=UPI0021189BE6|nr:monovalent cation:proton antiporter-2 (CPA2) family protein [Aurantimonas sp. MSK8Z-1]MCW4115293.1 monovalent cation:proton antiporter-2 (CPA2) family protein [Aurantimonas sp. MSK8Z-1]
MEATSTVFLQVILLLGGGIVAGTLFKRIGLGTVLGYLFAGIVLGPALRLVDGRDGSILHVGELGVVFLLFVIGLELKVGRLWRLRHQIFGLGLSQLVATGLALTGTAMLFGLGWRAAAVIGFGLAMSSTAFGLQILEEKGEMNTRYGQAAFSVLLFQDLAVVPLLALLPLLSTTSSGSGFDLEALAIAVGAILWLLLAGRFLLNPLFRILANAGAREVMIAAALFVVLGAGLLMQATGFSMGMGAFIAGVMLAESTYRHELEASIEPFRGILLGLFFMAVGLSLDLSVISRNWLLILAATPVVLVVKAVVLHVLTRAFGESRETSARVATLLPQGGEFGFVLFNTAVAAAILPAETASVLVAIVTLSMMLTPLTSWLGHRIPGGAEEEELDEDFDGAGSDVLMIGFSRFGQIVAQVLLSSGIDVTMIDNSAERIRTASRFGFRIYFGSGTNRDVLEAAGIRRALIVAVCTNKQETTDRIVDLIRAEFPEVRLFVRSYDRAHALSLRARGVDYELRETVESALVFGGETLKGLDVDPDIARRVVQDVRRRDHERLKLQEAEGLFAGRDMVVTRVVTPEPLVKPKQEAEVFYAGDGDDGTPTDRSARARRTEPVAK